MKAALPASATGKPIETWFQDEARAGQKGTHACVWARLAEGSVRRSRMEWQAEGDIGSRPAMVRDNRHDSACLFGAICPSRAAGAAPTLPSAHAKAVADHLAEISTQAARGAHAVLVCGNAGGHQAGGRLAAPDNATLLPLPPYSPEPNPMENVWEYLPANRLCALVWDSDEASVEACRTAWHSSSTILGASAQPAPGNGRVSAFRRIGISLRRGTELTTIRGRAVGIGTISGSAPGRESRVHSP